jgi:hypothetical protein
MAGWKNRLTMKWILLIVAGCFEIGWPLGIIGLKLSGN